MQIALQKMLILLVIKEIQIKIRRYHLPPTRMAIETKTVTSVDEDVEKLKPSHMVGGIVKWFRATLQNVLAVSQNAKHKSNI